MLIALGMRHSFGLFLNPVTQELAGVNRETFGFAIALQNLVWGLAQPFTGMIADRFGSARVILSGGLLYGCGLFFAAYSTTSFGLILGLGILVGLGLSATTFAVVLGAVGRKFPPENRSTALGMASLGGSVGILLSVPVTTSLIDNFNWSVSFIYLGIVAFSICFFTPALSGRSSTDDADQNLRKTMIDALKHKGFVLLMLGFFVCGFQLAFIGTHLPAYLADRNLDLWLGGAALAAIGAANIVGTYVCGAIGDRVIKKNALTVLYLIRATVVAIYIAIPATAMTTLIFSVVIGLTWLGTVPITSAIVGQIFGPKYLSTLIGIVFMMHQLGSFLGAWLGGLAFEQTGSYDLIWWSVVLLGVVAALLHWPIDEKPAALAQNSV